MKRPKRDAHDGVVYHVLNRANARMTIFESAGLVNRAERWRWGSLWRYVHGEADQRAILSP